jgi:hypothetical protein
MDTRRLILGDWHPLVRDGLDVGRAALAVAAAAYALAGELAGAGYLAVSAAVTIAARLADLPRTLDLALLVALAVTGFGEALGLYDRWTWFDRAVHFTVPMLLAPVIYIGFARVEIVPDPRDESGLRHRPSLWTLTFCFGMAVGGLWEIFEWLSDYTFGSNLSEGNADTVGDLMADALGAAAGGALLVLWSTRGWGSVRRIPGENRYEDLDA